MLGFATGGGGVSGFGGMATVVGRMVTLRGAAV